MSGLEGEQPPVEEAWVEFRDKKTGRKYYANAVTKKVTWRAPEDFVNRLPTHKQLQYRVNECSELRRKVEKHKAKYADKQAELTAERAKLANQATAHQKEQEAVALQLAAAKKEIAALKAGVSASSPQQSEEEEQQPGTPPKPRVDSSCCSRQQAHTKAEAKLAKEKQDLAEERKAFQKYQKQWKKKQQDKNKPTTKGEKDVSRSKRETPAKSQPTPAKALATPAKTDTEEAHTVCKQLEEQRSSLEKTVKELEERCAAKERALTDANMQLAQAQTALNKQMQSSEAQVQRLQTDLDQAQASCKTANEKMAGLQRELLTAKTELTKLRTRLQKRKGSSDKARVSFHSAPSSPHASVQMLAQATAAHVHAQSAANDTAGPSPLRPGDAAVDQAWKEEVTRGLAILQKEMRSLSQSAASSPLRPTPPPPLSTSPSPPHSHHYLTTTSYHPLSALSASFSHGAAPSPHPPPPALSQSFCFGQPPSRPSAATSLSFGHFTFASPVPSPPREPFPAELKQQAHLVLPRPPGTSLASPVPTPPSTPPPPEGPDMPDDFTASENVFINDPHNNTVGSTIAPRPPPTQHGHIVSSAPSSPPSTPPPQTFASRTATPSVADMPPVSSPQDNLNAPPSHARRVPPPRRRRGSLTHPGSISATIATTAGASPSAKQILITPSDVDAGLYNFNSNSLPPAVDPAAETLETSSLTEEAPAPVLTLPAGGGAPTNSDQEDIQTNAEDGEATRRRRTTTTTTTTSLTPNSARRRMSSVSSFLSRTSRGDSLVSSFRTSRGESLAFSLRSRADSSASNWSTTSLSLPPDATKTKPRKPFVLGREVQTITQKENEQPVSDSDRILVIRHALPPNALLPLTEQEKDGYAWAAWAKGHLTTGTRLPVNSKLVHSYSSARIKRPLTKLTGAAAKEALQSFKNILSYMGARESSRSPSHHAVKLLAIGLRGGSELRDEIYCQLLKQIHQNPNPTSRLRGWELLMLSCGTFPPSPALVNVLRTYLEAHAEHIAEVDMSSEAAHKNATSRALGKIAAMLLPQTLHWGARLTTPTPAEIEAVAQGKPLMIRCWLGNTAGPVCCAVACQTTVGEVLQTLEQDWRLPVGSVHMELVTSNRGELFASVALQRELRVLDVLERWNNQQRARLAAQPDLHLESRLVLSTLVYLKDYIHKLATASLGGRAQDAHPQALQLLFSQSVQDVVSGSLKVSNISTYIKLAGLQLQGDGIPTNQRVGVSAVGLCLPPELLQQESDQGAALWHQCRKARALHAELSVEQARQEYLLEVLRLPGYGVRFYPVVGAVNSEDDGEELTIQISQEGWQLWRATECSPDLQGGGLEVAVTPVCPILNMVEVLANPSTLVIKHQPAAGDTEADLQTTRLHTPSAVLVQDVLETYMRAASLRQTLPSQSASVPAAKPRRARSQSVYTLSSSAAPKLSDHARNLSSLVLASKEGERLSTSRPASFEKI